jgi:hypothetical protein
MMTSKVRTRWLAVAAMVFTGAAAADVDEARRIVDRAEPLRCEILILESRLKQLAAGTDEHAGLSAGLGEARKQLRLHYLATMDEYIAVMKRLPFEQRKAVYAYSEAVAERCAAKGAPAGADRIRPRGAD